MYISRYDFNDYAYVYRVFVDDQPQYRYVEILFEDNIEHTIEQKYAQGHNKVTCKKTVLKNGEFNIKFDTPYGSSGTSYGPMFWNTTISHKDLDEPICIGIPTYNILSDVIKATTIVNGEINNVYLASHDKNIIIVLPDDSKLADVRYDGEIRHKYLKHKTVKREPGYKYVSLTVDKNYLCEAAVLANSVCTAYKYGRYSKDEDDNNFVYSIRCGRFPITLYSMSKSVQYETTISELLSSEIDKLTESLNCLRKCGNVNDIDSFISSGYNYESAKYCLNSSLLYNVYTQDSLCLSGSKPKNKPLSKAKAWLKELNSIDIESELMKFRDRCQEKIKEFVDETGSPLHPSYLMYLIRMPNEVNMDTTATERCILDAVGRYCEMSNRVYRYVTSTLNNSKNGSNVTINGKSYTYTDLYCFSSYDTSEMLLIY